MKGRHHIVLETKRIKYSFSICRNITIIQGDSATGKTTLVGLLAEYANFRGQTGISLSSDVPCVVFRPATEKWDAELAVIENSIVFIDEEYTFVRSKAFADAVRGSTNYFVLITRTPLPNLPYSVTEIYGIRNSGKYHYPEKIYHEFYPLYADRKTAEKTDGNILIVEDSRAGFQFFSNALQDGTCVSANGNAGILATAKAFAKENAVTIIADGAAFGAYVEEMTLFLKHNSTMSAYFPESFEWLILRSGAAKILSAADILAHPEDYIESSLYFSWERYFAELLETETAGDAVRAYHKERLAPYYMEGRAKTQILSALPQAMQTALTPKNSS